MLFSFPTTFFLRDVKVMRFITLPLILYFLPKTGFVVGAVVGTITGVLVATGTLVFVGAIIGVLVTTGVLVLVGAIVGVFEGVEVLVAVGVLVAVRVGVIVGVLLEVRVGVTVGVAGVVFKSISFAFTMRGFAIKPERFELKLAVWTILSLISDQVKFTL